MLLRWKAFPGSFRKEATSIRRVAIAGNTMMEYLLGRDAACIRKNEPDPLEFHDLLHERPLNWTASGPPDQLNLKGDLYRTD